jgi:hypothetical protein
MGRAALNIRDKPYSASIMFIFRPVKSLTTTLVSPLVFTHDKLLTGGPQPCVPKVLVLNIPPVPKLLFLYGIVFLCKISRCLIKNVTENDPCLKLKMLPKL